MGLFDFFTIHVFSEVSGVVTFQGKPVEGAKIIRTGDHEEDKVYTDTTTTDKDGKFSFKGIATFSLRPIMMGTIIRQKIVIKYQGMKYLAWETLKRNNYKYGELNDENVENPIKLHLFCELTNSQETKTYVELKYGPNGVVYGLCRWDGWENLVTKKRKEES